MLDDATLEAAAQMLEERYGNDAYQKAWKAAAKLVRDMKKLTDASSKLTDNAPQITSSSGRPV